MRTRSETKFFDVLFSTILYLGTLRGLVFAELGFSKFATTAQLPLLISTTVVCVCLIYAASKRCDVSIALQSTEGK